MLIDVGRIDVGGIDVVRSDVGRVAARFFTRSNSATPR
jgi:hypothetical protein